MTNIIPVPQKYDFTVLQAHKVRRVLGQYRIILSADTASEVRQDAVPQLPERCLSRKAGIVRCCLRMKAQHAAHFGIYLSGWSCWRWALTGWGHRPLYQYHAPSARGPDGILPT